MSFIHSLRRLRDLQQFPELKSAAQHYIAETADIQAKPLLALACANLGERAECEQLVSQLDAAIDSLDADARIDLAAVYCMIQRVEDALVVLKAEYTDNPNHALLLARLGWCHMVLGDSGQAVQLYQRSVELEPHRLPAWLSLVDLYLQLSDFSQAQQALDHAVEQFYQQQSELPEPVGALFTEKLRYLQLEQWLVTDNQVQAEAWLNERRADIEEDEWTALVAGYAMLLAGYDRHSAADEALRAALKHYPDNLSLMSQRAELAQVQGRTMQAVQILKRAIHQAKQQDKPEVVFWVRLSAACLHTMKPQARKAAEKSDRTSRCDDCRWRYA